MERRRLEFHDLGEVVHDAEALAARGYDKAGHWDLAQTCHHLAGWMTFPLDGFPKTIPAPIRLMLWVARHTVGPKKFRQILASREMPTGKPTIRETVAAPGGDETAAVRRLKDTAERFLAHAGPIHPSPLFGPMTKDEAVKLQLVHCAHHLSFLRPRA